MTGVLFMCKSTRQIAEILGVDKQFVYRCIVKCKIKETEQRNKVYYYDKEKQEQIISYIKTTFPKVFKKIRKNHKKDFDFITLKSASENIQKNDFINNKKITFGDEQKIDFLSIKKSDFITNQKNVLIDVDDDIKNSNESDFNNIKKSDFTNVGDNDFLDDEKIDSVEDEKSDFSNNKKSVFKSENKSIFLLLKKDNKRLNELVVFLKKENEWLHRQCEVKDNQIKTWAQAAAEFSKKSEPKIIAVKKEKFFSKLFGKKPEQKLIEGDNNDKEKKKSFWKKIFG